MSNDAQAYLTQIKTHWSNIFRAQRPEGDTALIARQEMLLRYHEAVYRYLLAKMPEDPNGAADLYSDFAVRALEPGGFLHKADQSKGKFRHFLKAVLRNMVMDYYRKRGRKGEAKPIEDPDLLADSTAEYEDADEEAFVNTWRQEMLNRAYEALENAQAESKQPYYTVLRYRADHPEMTSAQVAEAFTQQFGRPFTAVNVRQISHRAKDLFAELLLQEVVRSLELPSTDAASLDKVEDELIKLRLLPYCQDALQAMREKKK